MNTQLQGKVVFITGASSGIGEACAEQFAQAGAKLILTARRIEILNELAEKWRKQYQAEVLTYALDVTQYTQITEIIANLSSAWRDVDILINNAGLAYGLEPLQEGNVHEWDTIIDTNVKGLLYVTREILPLMVKRNKGHIINIGSISGHSVYPKGVVYCATKFAVNAITQGLRMDLLGTKIRVTTIDPGAVETNFSKVRFHGDEDRAASVYEGFEPLIAHDVADAVLYCASRAPHINISEMIVMPTDQVSVMMIARKQKDNE